MSEPARPLPAPPSGTHGARALAAPAAVLLVATRPRQWAKNLLVFAAPVAAGALLRPAVLPAALLAAVAFTAASAGTYLLNDVSDAERDRRHPSKRYRPVAAGLLPARVAVAAGAALAAAAVLTPLAADRPALAQVVAGYLLLTLCYARWLKHLPGVELAAIAAGFLLRPLAGAVATGVPPSRWFLLVCALGSLTVAFGKRGAELRAGGVAAVRSRPVLAHYRLGGLVAGRWLAAAGAVGAYLGWAVTRGSPLQVETALASAVPFAAALLRYIWCNEQGLGEAPEDVVLGDRPLQALGLGWLVVFLVEVCGG